MKTSRYSDSQIPSIPAPLNCSAIFRPLHPDKRLAVDVHFVMAKPFSPVHPSTIYRPQPGTAVIPQKTGCT